MPESPKTIDDDAERTAASESSAAVPIGVGSALLAAVCAALWGGTVVAIKISVDDIPPFGAAGLRFALAALCMFLWCRWRGTPVRPRSWQVFPVFMTGLLLYIQIGLLNVATDATSASNATLLLNLYPVFTVVLAHFLKLEDKINWRTSLGLAIALTGVLLVLRAPESDSNLLDHTSLTGDLLAVASALVLAARVLYTKKILPLVGSGPLLFWHDIVAVIFFLLTSALFEGFGQYQFTQPAVLSLLFQGLVVAGFCYAAWTTLLRKHRASQLVVFGFITPLCGVLFSHLLRGDALGPGLLVGGAAIATGVTLVNIRG